MTSDYGTYRLTYTPPESHGNEDYPAIAIEMSTTGDANVEQMLRFYEAFLAAAGYVLKGDLVISEPESDHWLYTTTEPHAANFVPFSLADDVISFGGK